MSHDSSSSQMYVSNLTAVHRQRWNDGGRVEIGCCCKVLGEQMLLCAIYQQPHCKIDQLQPLHNVLVHGHITTIARHRDITASPSSPCAKICHSHVSTIPRHHTDGVESHQDAQLPTKTRRHPLKVAMSSALNGRIYQVSR
jgi:hypothetical protein